MISFVSLFLGLAFGPQTVEVHVDASVVAVEILLDGEQVGGIEGPPWTTHFTFGDELSPHHLEAVAVDSAGEEIGRATQWVNIPRQPAEASILLDQATAGMPQRIRVSWESLVETAPSEIRVSFDGQPLIFEDPDSIALPAHDPEQLHFIRADLEFGGVVSSKAELIFGGGYADQVSSELTAVPVELDNAKDLPPLEEMQSWFEVDGKPLRAAAVEKGLAEVVIVRDFGAWENLARIRRTAVSNTNRRNWWFSSRHPAWNKWAFQFFWPVSRRQVGAAGNYDLFPPSAKHQAKDGSLHGWITTVPQPNGGGENQRLADCVAVAGVTAASGNRRRAVVLVLGESPRDGSDLSARQARRYLEQLHVPLFVWTTSSKTVGSSEGWGEVIDVSTDIRMARASKDLFKVLERQRMVWLDGTYLPQEIVLTPQVSGVSLTHPIQQSG